MSQETVTFMLRGGLDIETPSVTVPQGFAIGAENYEPVVNGYRRVDGFERLDGQPAPSKATYWAGSFSEGVGAPLLPGERITGALSGATGEVLAEPGLISGAWGVDAAGRLALWRVAGAFAPGEMLTVAGLPRARLDGQMLRQGSLTDAEDAAWSSAVRAAARAAILQPPGVGAVLGVWSYGGAAYAIRDQADGRAALFKATPGGWVQQNLGQHIRFIGGAIEPDEGAVLTGQTSGATAIVRRVARHQGDWNGTAKGLFALSDVSGTFFAGEPLLASGAVSALATSGTIINRLPAGGRYDFHNHNFFGASNGLRMYAACGEGPAWEWDGAVFVPIFTGMVDDRPTRVRAHANHLFLAYRGGSLQHSATGDPYAWSVVLGAAELGIGDEISGLSTDLASTLLVMGRSKIAVLYGSSIDDWQLDTYSNESGAKPWTLQRIGDRPIFMDDGGVRDFRLSDRFGDFQLGTMTELVRKLVAGKLKAGVEPIASLRSKEKAQYRLFFADGSGLTLYLGRKDPEILPFRLPVRVTCTCSAEDLAGNEVLLAGTDDGWVVQLDSGRSHDGAAIRAFLRLPFNHLRQPLRNKRFHKVVVDLLCSTSCRLSLTADYGFGGESGSPSTSGGFTVSGGGGFWEEALWDTFIWSAAFQGQAVADIDGFGTNCSILILSEASEEEPHTLQAAHLYISMRGLQL